jgi:uncharacterized protein (DUF302 family)
VPVPDDVRRVASAGSFEETVSHLRAVIQERGLTLFAEIDHQQNARDAGLEMPKTRVLIFGNGRGGTPLMVAAPDIALELPLRVLIREEPDGSVVLVYVDPERLAATFGIAALAKSIAGLTAIVEAAAAPVPL